MHPEDNPRAAPLVAAVHLDGGCDRLLDQLVHGREVRLVLVNARESGAAREAPIAAPGALAAPGLLTPAGLSIDTRSRVVTFDGHPVLLRRLEHALLVHLAQEPRRVFTRSELLRDVWGFKSDGRSRTVDTHASRLRHALRRAGATGWVPCSYGVGYSLLAGTEALTAPL